MYWPLYFAYTVVPWLYDQKSIITGFALLSTGNGDGKLLSYCPTFDNRAVYKTAQRVERIRKSSTMIKKNMNIVASSPAAARVNKVRGFVNIFLWSKMMIEFVANH